MDTKEKIEVMQAYLDGKKIQVQGKFPDGEWEDWIIKETPSWDWSSYDYRIKPEEKKPTYRPYKNTEEMIADYCLQFGILKTFCRLPLIWVKVKSTGHKTLCIGYSQKYVSTDEQSWNMDELLKDFTYLDGTPCGKLVEE